MRISVKRKGPKNVLTENGKRRTYLSSLQRALHDLMGQDERVILLGEDILDPYGGAFKVSAGLSTRFPDRVLTTPISEAAIVGAATGLALRGFLPIVEIMFGDFLTLCTDQILNHAVKFETMYNCRVNVPLVIRTPMGGGRGYGPTHSQSLEKLFLGIPGLTVVAPSGFHDPGALLERAVLETPSPVLFIEHKTLYSTEILTQGGCLSVEWSAQEDGFPTAWVTNYTAGSPDLTLISYGGSSLICLPVLQKMAEEEIRILAVFPSRIHPLPVEPLLRSAARTGRVVVLEEGGETFNWGSEVASVLYERLWRQLKTPIQRVASRNTALPASRRLEKETLIRPDQVEAAIMEVL